jgi:hypothetical protein
MRVSIHRFVCAAVVVLLGFSLVRAANTRFRDKEDSILKACRDQLRASGQTAAAMKTRFPTPEIGLATPACLLPGATGEVAIKGKFAPGTQFVFENDNLEVVKESLSGGEYRATLKAAPGIGPQSAGVRVITPGSCTQAQQSNVVLVGGRYEWTMKSANGWTIVARSTGQPCDRSSGDGAYEVSFYRNGESNPFEKRSASLYYSMYEKTNYRFSISREDPAAKASMDSYMSLMQRVSDPKLSPAQRDALMKQLEQMATQMQADMKKQIDPAYQKQLQEKQLQFGCENIALEVAGSSYTGTMRCAQKVGSSIAVTGTVAAR